MASVLRLLMAIGTYTVPTVDDDGIHPDLDAFDTQAALDAALESVLYLELDCTDCFKLAAGWSRVHALVALNEGP